MSDIVSGYDSHASRAVVDVKSVSVVIPVYNEEERITDSLRTLDEFFATRPDLRVDFVIVDDGSADASLERCREIVPELRHPVTLLTHGINQGLGGALRTGIANTTGDIVTVVDSDLSYGVEDIVATIDEEIRTRAHVVIASAYMPGGHSIAVPPALERRSRLANSLLSWAAIGKIHTLTGMVRSYDGPHIRSLSLKAVDVDINSEILYKPQVLRGSIVEIPATLNWSAMEDRAGRSGLLSSRSRWNTAKALVNAFLFRPFLFPLMPVSLLLVLSVAAFLIGGTAGISVGVALVLFSAMLSVTAVLMLQLKRYFEELYSAVTRRSGIMDQPSHGRVVVATGMRSESRTP